MCGGDAQILIEKLDSVFNVCWEAGLAELISEQKKMVTTVKRAFQVEKDNAGSTTGSTVVPKLIGMASFNDKLKNIYFTPTTLLESGL